MYSFLNLEPVCFSMSSSNCYFLTCILISQEAVKVAWYSHLLKNFPQFVVIHTVQGVTVVNETEIDVFLELFFFFYDPMDVGSLIPCSSAFSKSSLYIGIFLVHVLLKPSLENFEHYFASMWDECSCAAVVWTLLGTAFLWDPEIPQRLRQNCVWVSPAEVWVSSGLPQGQGLWLQSYIDIKSLLLFPYR